MNTMIDVPSGRSRREFMQLLAGAGGCAMLSGCLSGSAAKAPAIAGDFAWGALLHLGSNMWGDWKPDLKGVPSSAEEERRMYPDQKLNNERFFEFFVFTLGRLKARFPDLKFGGPAVCYRDEGFLRGLLAKCREAGYAPDFISWHNYSCAPDMMLGEPARIRAICDEYGFKQTELMINEWHYITPGNFWGQFNTPAATAQHVDPTTGLGGINSAVYTIQVLCGLQATCLDQAYFYGCGYTLGSNWGILKADGQPNKVYYGLKAFGSALAVGNTIVKSQGTKDVRLFGVVSGDGARKALLVSAFKTKAGEIGVDVKGVAPDAKVSCLLLDDKHDLVSYPATFAGGKLTLRKSDDHSAAFLVTFE